MIFCQDLSVLLCKIVVPQRLDEADLTGDLFGLGGYELLCLRGIAVSEGARASWYQEASRGTDLVPRTEILRSPVQHEGRVG